MSRCKQFNAQSIDSLFALQRLCVRCTSTPARSAAETATTTHDNLNQGSSKLAKKENWRRSLYRLPWFRSACGAARNRAAAGPAAPHAGTALQQSDSRNMQAQQQ